MPLIVVRPTVSCPPSLRIPPPEPEPLDAALWAEVLRWTDSEPPSLNSAPPPWSASVPLAMLPVSSVRSTVMVPVPEFHRPPPSAAAVLPVTVERLTRTSPTPVRCRAPPLPGIGPVEFASRTVSSIDVVPALASIAPPARLACLPENLESSTFSVPPRLATAPPEAPMPRTRGVREAYTAHGAELFRFALRSLGDGGAAEDVVQETFLRAWRSRHRYDPSLSTLRVWLFSIARNVVIDQSRATAARPWQRTVVDLTATGHVGEVVADPSEKLLRGWIVDEALRRLGEEHRHALTETYLADRPYAEVAAELGIPVSTLRSRVFYGLKALRVVMEEMEVTS